MKWERKAIPFVPEEFKEADDRWEFNGWVAKYKNVDRMDDRLLPGSFKRTIDHRGEKAFPLMLMHDTLTFLGGVFLKETAQGVKAAPGFLLKSIQLSANVRDLMKLGIIDGFSFSFRAIQYKYVAEGTRMVRELSEVRIGEVTLGPQTMIANPQAVLTSIKNVDTKTAQRALEEFRHSVDMRRLASAHKRYLSSVGLDPGEK